MSIRSSSPDAARSAEGDSVLVEFIPRGFRSILELVRRAGYSFVRFGDPSPERAFYLRHDVDLSPLMALELGEIEKETGVSSNFFFQPNADTYNIFDPSVMRVIHSLREMGHLVGLHIDEALFSTEEGTVCETLDWFSTAITPIDSAGGLIRSGRRSWFRQATR